MSEINLIKFPECPKFLDEAITPVAKEIGKTFGNIFYSIFSIINYPSEKLRIKQSENLKKYEQDIKNELYKIPEKNLIEPPLNVVGPALEASKFYIEQPELRKMFAKLIASSMNIDNIEFSHPVFVEFIKQLSPLDAKIFKELYLNRSNYGLAEICLNTGYNSRITLYKTFFPLSCLNSSTLIMVQASIDNLIRLGLIQINPNLKSTNESIYETIYQHEVYKELKKYVCDSKNNKVFACKMLWDISMLGINFAKICF